MVNNPNIADSLRYIPISEMINPANFNINSYTYAINPWTLKNDGYEGYSNTHAGYVMLDDRLTEKVRLVWGLRAEYFKYTEVRNETNVKGGGTEFKLPAEKKWQWLPSANLTYSPTNQINLRVATSATVIRPELMDNSQFFRYDPNLGAQFSNRGLASTRINNYDFKAEWFPGLGEVISAGAFFKKFDKPTELNFDSSNGNIYYFLRNADNAKVYGLEFELRKNLGFIANHQILTNITLYGNLTLQKSNVTGTYQIKNPNGPNLPDILLPLNQKRPMYGQAPYLVNFGMQYTGDALGFNIAYNKSGYKTYIVSSSFNQIEYEQARAQIDAQLSYKFLKKRLELKVNAANLLNKASTFYINSASYERKTDYKVGDGDLDIQLKPGFSDKYDEGDMIMYRQKFGRTYSTSLTYNF